MSAPEVSSARAVRWPRFRLGAEGRKLAIGILLIAGVLYGQELFGVATANTRLDSSLRGATRPSNIVVVLDFMPERFHNERIAEYGVFAGRDGALNRIRLRMVSPRNLADLASIPWVSRIEPMH
jgi:hypothetical protein